MLKFFKAIGYLITFQFNKFAEILYSKPAVIAAQMDKIISNKESDILNFKKAIGSKMSAQEGKVARLNKLKTEVAVLEQKKNGAIKKAKEVNNKYNNRIFAGDHPSDKTPEELTKADPEYIKHSAAAKDFISTLNAKKSEIEELEKDVKERDFEIENDENAIISMIRELERLRDEKQDTVSDIEQAEREKRQGNIKIGITKQQDDSDLIAIRRRRSEAKAEAKVTKRLAGMDVKSDEEQYLSSFADDSAQAELDAAIFGNNEQKKLPMSSDHEVLIISPSKEKQVV